MEAFLEVQPRVADRLDELSRELFGNILEEIELNLTYALREVLGQDLRVVLQGETKNRKMHVSFSMLISFGTMPTGSTGSRRLPEPHPELALSCWRRK